MLIVLLVLLFLAAVWDFCCGKIPNMLVVTGICYGIIRLLSENEILRYISGIIIPLIVFFPLYKIGVIGAGDVKLFSMLGFYLLCSELIYCIFISFLLGALLSILSFIRYENFLERMSYAFSYLKDCICQGHFRYYYLDSKGNILSDSECSRTKIHFAIPIFISVLLHVGGVF